MPEQIRGDEIDQLLREATAEIASLSPIAPDLHDLGGLKVAALPEKETSKMNVRHALLGAAAAVIAVVVLVIVIGGNNDTDTADIPTTTTSAPETTTTTSTTSTTSTTTTTTVPTPAVFDTNATVLTEENFNQLLSDDSFRTDELGTPFTFANVGGLFTALNEAGFLVLRESGGGLDDRTLNFVRPWHLVDPVAPNTEASVAGAGWRAADVEGWLSQLPPELEITGRETTEIGGQSAEFFEMRLSEDVDCLQDQVLVYSCYAFLNYPAFEDHPTPEVLETFAAAFIRVGINSGATYRVWWIDQNGETPIIAVAATLIDSDTDFLDRVDDIMATVAFDSIEPSPFDQPDSLFE